MLYRVRQRLNRDYFAWRTRAVLDTPPIACAATSPCAIHTMLSLRDVPMYLPAIKSLLQYCPPLRVVVHSDGSLDAGVAALLQRHLPGIVIVSGGEADDKAREALGSDSYLWRWRAHDASWRRVIDTELWCTTARRIVIDPDVVVLRRPDALLAWMTGGDRPFLFGQPPGPNDTARLEANPRFIQTMFRHHVHGLAQRLGLPAGFPQGATSGFYGCLHDLTLDRIERVLRAGEAEGLPMTQWGSEQCTVIYLLACAGAARLDPARYLNYDPGCAPLVDHAVALHFYGTYRYHRRLYPRLAAQVVARLREPGLARAGA